MKKHTDEKEYHLLMATIEDYLQKASSLIGFSSSTTDEANDLAYLSKLAEEYEDSISTMPVRNPTE